MDAAYFYPPVVCPHCKWARRLSMAHRLHCPTLEPTKPPFHQIAPGLFVGAVEARAHPRFRAVVSILSEADARYVGTRVPMPESDVYHIQHSDGEGGLLSKCEPAWQFVDEHRSLGDVLIHCLQGANRSPTVCAGYRITRDGLSAEQALSEVLRRRPPAWHINSANVADIVALGR